MAATGFNQVVSFMCDGLFYVLSQEKHVQS